MRQIYWSSWSQNNTPMIFLFYLWTLHFECFSPFFFSFALLLCACENIIFVIRWSTIAFWEVAELNDKSPSPQHHDFQDVNDAEEERRDKHPQHHRSSRGVPPIGDEDSSIKDNGKQHKRHRNDIGYELWISVPWLPRVFSPEKRIVRIHTVMKSLCSWNTH